MVPGEVHTAQQSTTRCPRSRRRAVASASAIPYGAPEAAPLTLPSIDHSAVLQSQQSASSPSPLQALEALTAPLLKGDWPVGTYTGALHWQAAAPGGSGTCAAWQRSGTLLLPSPTKLPSPLHSASSPQT